MYDWKGRYIEQDDPPEPTQPHCPDCGAFLSWKPAGTHPCLVYADYVYDNQGEITGIANAEYEDVEYWQCKKCGRSHNVEAVPAR